MPKFDLEMFLKTCEQQKVRSKCLVARALLTANAGHQRAPDRAACGRSRVRSVAHARGGGGVCVCAAQ